MKPNEAKKVAQCVADMINVDLKHSVRHVPLVLNELLNEYLATYVPEKPEEVEIVESGSSVE